jgi:hypothetical protein
MVGEQRAFERGTSQREAKGRRRKAREDEEVATDRLACQTVQKGRESETSLAASKHGDVGCPGTPEENDEQRRVRGTTRGINERLRGTTTPKEDSDREETV